MEIHAVASLQTMYATLSCEEVCMQHHTSGVETAAAQYLLRGLMVSHALVGSLQL